MKKFVSIALALVLALSLTVVAFAAAVDSGETPLTQTITVSVEAKATNDAYAAVVTWDLPTTELTYKTEGKTWNTETLTWDVGQGGDAAGWADTYDFAGGVTVENRSSQAITATVTSNNANVTVANADYEGTIAAPEAGADAGVEEAWTITIAQTAPAAAYEATITVALS